MHFVKAFNTVLKRRWQSVDLNTPFTISKADITTSDIPFSDAIDKLACPEDMQFWEKLMSHMTFEKVMIIQTNTTGLQIHYTEDNFSVSVRGDHRDHHMISVTLDGKDIMYPCSMLCLSSSNPKMFKRLNEVIRTLTDVYNAVVPAHPDVPACQCIVLN